MLQVILLARLIAALLGADFDAEQDCTENERADQPRYVCEWWQNGDDEAGLYFGVWSDGDTVEWTVEYMPGYVPETLRTVTLSPTETTIVQVEMGDDHVFYSSNGVWLEVLGPYYYGRQMDAFRVVVLAPGEGKVPFLSDGEFWISTYQIPPPPDPA